MDKHSETGTYYTGSKLENISTVKCEILSKTDECDPVYATKCQKMWVQYKVTLLLFGVSKGTKS